MSDRFYQQQLDTVGWCAGFKGTKTLDEYEQKFGKLNRRRKVAWTDESKAQAVEMYTAENPTPENSMEIVKSIADELGESPNGVRMILTKAGVYVRKTPAPRSSGGSTGGGRVNVAAAQEELSNAITDMGKEADAAIIGKLTGKAAKYFADLINELNS